jgi:hypothetical protein
VVLCGAVWCCAVLCGAVWCCVFCGVVLCFVILDARATFVHALWHVSVMFSVRKSHRFSEADVKGGVTHTLFSDYGGDVPKRGRGGGGCV